MTTWQNTEDQRPTYTSLSPVLTDALHHGPNCTRFYFIYSIRYSKVGWGSSAAIIFKQSGKNMTSNLIYVINETLTFYFRFYYNFALKLM